LVDAHGGGYELWFDAGGAGLVRIRTLPRALDIDPSRPNDNLDAEIEDYPEIKRAMSTLNRRYLEVSQRTTVLVIINFVLSAVYMRSALTSAGTFTSLLSFLVLVMIKLLTTRTKAQASVHRERALSAYMTVHKTFNVIDPDYRRQEFTSIAALQSPSPTTSAAASESSGPLVGVGREGGGGEVKCKPAKTS
jgi:hypothetical protein